MCVSLSLRLLRRLRQALHLRALHGDKISETNLWSHARPHGHGEAASKSRARSMKSCRAIASANPPPTRCKRTPASSRRGRDNARGSRTRLTLSATQICAWPKCVSRRCKLDETSESLVRAAMSQLQLSARAYHQILKSSRTIADLAGSDKIESAHLAEALHALRWSSEVGDGMDYQANQAPASLAEVSS